MNEVVFPTHLLIKISVLVLASVGGIHSQTWGQIEPGSLYKEFALHNGGNKDWRVTDRKAVDKFPRAGQFLPNPKLELDIDDLEHAISAEVLIDRWGGHIGTVNKRIRFNDQSWITLPEITNVPDGIRPEMLMYQDNPTVPIPISDLTEGVNVIEGDCDEKGGFGWGQWGLNSVVVRIYYDATAKGKDFQISGRITSPRTGEIITENPVIKIDAAAEMGVARIDVLAKHYNFDVDGDGEFDEFQESHFQLVRGSNNQIRDHVGTLWKSPYQIKWDTHWVPDQKPAGIALLARIQDSRGYWTVTPIVQKLTLFRDKHSVRLFAAQDVPLDFSVRAGETKSCSFEISNQVQMGDASEAALHLRTWHGWDKHHEPILLNDFEMKINGKNHFYDYDLLPVPVDTLRAGLNKFSIHSKTEHHMMEVLWPGPAVVVRLPKPSVKIEDATYEGRPHFVITTLSATYWLDKNSGGLSRLVDVDGNDWIAYQSKPWNEYPPSAASSFRGLPNLVFGGSDNGFGHPGWDQAESQIENAQTIVCNSRSGDWQIRWQFTSSDATVAVTPKDPTTKYWFLYEGPIAGRWSPKTQYFATDLSPPTKQPHDYFREDRLSGNWRWAYFGDQSVPRILYILHQEKDELDDTFSHLGNSKKGLNSDDGMVVFGIGRGIEGIDPQLTGKNSFRIGFREQAGATSIQYDEIKPDLDSLIPSNNQQRP